ncbi:MAG TPA: oxidoreductase [Acidimicrobiales bacterium]|jgi:NAD(P)-dependent dehydrogenase (short-subunit alcohol dehydrogenase family)
MTTKWNAVDVPDQSGRTILITGANSGIGLEAARVLVSSGAHVVLACRSRDKAEAANAEITATGPEGTTEIVDLDLSDLEQVSVAAKTFTGAHDRLDVLVNNAGVMATPHRTTAQGFELQLGTNHLGHFALTAHLLDTLLATSGSRVVTISSQAHRFGRINFSDLQSERRYSAWRAYGQSKLANLLFTFELQRRLEAAGQDTVALAAHPGGSRTNLGHESSGGLLGSIMSAGKPLFDRVMAQSAAMGALPTLRAATDPDASGGDYYGPDGVGEQRGHPIKRSTTARARDIDAAQRLWSVSEELTGVTFAL